METNNNEQIDSLTRELDLMRERYLKLVDVHGQLQTQNSLLEERILNIVETYSNERDKLEQDLIDAKEKVLHLEDTVEDLEIEKQRYKDDCNLAVRLLHRHPNEFMSTATTEHIQEQLKNKSELTPTNQPMQLQHSLLIPTFPPTFVTSLPLVNTTTSPSPVVAQPTTTIDNLRLAESLFKSNAVHRFPSTHFVCSNCHKTIKCCDVSVQTSLDDHNVASRTRLISLTGSDDEILHDISWTSLEPHHAHMTVQEYQMGNTRKAIHDTGLPLNSIPQMHHV